MNDLIRRKDVLAALEEAFNQYGVSWGEQYGGFASVVPSAIKNIPTAYDVKSVVEQLDSLKEQELSMHDFSAVRGIKRAIEIVKGANNERN